MHFFNVLCGFYIHLLDFRITSLTEFCHHINNFFSYRHKYILILSLFPISFPGILCNILSTIFWETYWVIYHSVQAKTCFSSLHFSPLINTILPLRSPLPHHLPCPPPLHHSRKSVPRGLSRPHNFSPRSPVAAPRTCPL